MSTASSVSDSEPISCSLPSRLASAIAQAHRQWDAAQKTERLWNRDASLWGGSGTPLQWLDLVETQIQDLSHFKALSAEVKEDGFKHLVVLATDGSASAAEAMRHASRKQNGCLEWTALDTTDPAVVRNVQSGIDPARTLFCSLHGLHPSPETDLLAAHFFEETKKIAGAEARLHFLEVTSAEAVNRTDRRHVYSSNAAGISPAWGAFSEYGLVPLAAAGQDVEKLLNGARHMAQLCKDSDSRRNPGVTLGLTLGTAAASFGHNKVTLVCSPSLRALADWIGHLLSTSAGSETIGIVPILTEPSAPADTYPQDRLFVHLRLAHESDRSAEKHIAALESAGHAVVRLVIDDACDLGQPMFQWQIAAAVASTHFEHRTSPLDSQYSDDERTLVRQGGLTIFAEASYAAEVMRRGDSAGAVLRRHLDRLNPGETFGMVAYVPNSPAHCETLQMMRRGVLHTKSAATVLGFGPGFLATAGAALLHGPSSGVLLLITCDSGGGISLLAEATAGQARRDFRALAQAGRSVIRVHLASDVAKGLNQLQDLVCAAVEH